MAEGKTGHLAEMENKMTQKKMLEILSCIFFLATYSFAVEDIALENSKCRDISILTAALLSWALLFFSKPISNPSTNTVSLTSKYIQNAITFRQVSHPLISSIHWHFSPENLERLFHSIKHQIPLETQHVTAVLKTFQWLPVSLSSKSDTCTAQLDLTPSYLYGLSSSYSCP